MVSSRDRRAAPSDIAAMMSRSTLSPRINRCQASPIPPITLATGTDTSVKNTSLTVWPSIVSIGQISRPGESVGR